MISRRFASSVASSSTAGGSRKIVLVGAGFLGSYIARALIADPRNRVQIVSRNPQKLYDTLRPLGTQILPPHSADITNPDTTELNKALDGAAAVVSLVGVLAGTEKIMQEVQLRGAERVAEAAKKGGVGRIVMMSAIGSDRNGETPYFRTKAQAEDIYLATSPTATIIRPSIVFGPGDSFFNRFSALAKFLPFLPVFGGGVVKFQPVYVGDVARAVEICCRDDPKVIEQVGGKVIEAGGPDVFTYREIMGLVLRYSGLKRFIISLPYWVGMIQGAILERLPENIFTLTRDQVKQLKYDNIVSPTPPLNSLSFTQLLTAFPSSLPSSSPPERDAGLKSVHDILPTYLGPAEAREEGKRTHGRKAGGFEDVQKLKSRTK